VTKPLASLALTVLLVTIAGGQPHAQQSVDPVEDAKKAAAAQAAKDRAGQESLNKMIAEQSAIKAEAEARAQLKIRQEEAARQRAEDLARIAKAEEVVPVDVEIVVSRFQGDKKVSTLPYALTVNAKDTPEQVRPLTQLRMGGRVPLPVMAPALGPDGKSLLGITGGGPVQYEDIGTSIDARARPMGDGRFELTIMVEDSAVAMPQGADAQAAGLPVIRKFRSSNNLVLRDGQTRQFTAAADRITGEVVKVDVTLKVAK
jgi:hypothetical protein